MKPNSSVGILGYGAYVPIFRLPTSEVGRVWRGEGAGPNKEKAVAHHDEDTFTMACEMARRAVRMAGVTKLGAVLVGTESKPYVVKPTSTILAQALGQHFALAADLEFACKAGTEAMQFNIALVASGMIQAGLAAGVDTAQGRPGDELEYTAASGGAAFVIGRGEEALALFERSTSYVSDTGDFWRRPGEKFPSHLGRFTGEPAYFHHIETCVRAHLEEVGHKPSDYRWAVFHQPNPRFPVEVGLKLGFKMEQMEPGLLNTMIGNTYAGSSLMGLAATLDVAEPGDRILMASFGSGAGSDAFTLIVTDKIVEKRKLGVPVRDMIDRSVKVDYAVYSRFRGKLYE
jgi:hydroxymethylglutaryl-CoA synthase